MTRWFPRHLEGVRLIGSSEPGYVVHVKQTGDDLALVTCAIVSDKGVWRIWEGAPEDLEPYDPFGEDPYP
jgi:hypothetical protein